MTAEDLCMAIKALPWGIRDKQAPHLIAAALHREREEALNEAAQRIAWLQPEHNAREAQRQIRELKSPAAAPAPDWSVRAGDKCTRVGCDKRVVAACLPHQFGGCDEHMREHDSRCAFAPLNRTASPVAQGKEKG